MSVGSASRPESELTEEERRLLSEAHAELRAAVAAYEAFRGEELQPGEAVPVVRTEDLQRAQERVEAGEDRLWYLRERLLGWPRPPWVPRASLVADWFSDEDAVYDEVTDQPES